MDEMAAHRQRWRERMVTHFIRSFMVFNLDFLLPAFGEISICQVFLHFTVFPFVYRHYACQCKVAKFELVSKRY